MQVAASPLPLGMSIERVAYTPRTPDAQAPEDFVANRCALTPDQIAADPVASAAADTVGKLANWAVERGLTPVLDAMHGATVHLCTGMTTDNAYSADLEFFEPERRTERHLASSPEVLSHEISHRIVGAYSKVGDDDRLRNVNEGLADIFSVVFARAIGYGPAQNDFKIGDELGGRIAGTGLRDLANPQSPSLRVAQIVARPSDTYATAEPLTLAFTRLVDQLGDERAGEIAIDAIVNQLPSIIGDAPVANIYEGDDAAAWRDIDRQYDWVHQAFLAAAGSDAATVNDVFQTAMR